MRIDVGDLKAGEAEALGFSYSILAKSREDLALIQRAAVQQ
jgi:hypothetical protein